ncbi:SMP-30/gluconolactonase/LRE family protein [Variovorax sp. J22G73]|uniref:SMP-30/gluconolactonase/LRE family protein n=1 Tax=unclassified Variovorax TaxID=663243 RepID=UPI0025783A8A|nr:MULTISPECIES: SMP-30/gluconolactonase/LRE family protein [unclassified Variovorax]MDM0010617.1 SMP-30/gluconolactonase/LRE family protein [Variovorax sp. J22R203]MDM0103055.1 SMP-30/gluconolactonase/LRE family protein [Variovorax sp. J22G73]
MHAPRSAEQIVPTALPHPSLQQLVAWPVGCKVGESPVWHRSEAALYWIDVRAPHLLRLDPQTGELSRWQLPEVVGALALCGDSHAWLALQHRLVQIDLLTGKLHEVAVVDHVAENRLNDGKVSPSGQWFVFGSMDDRAEKQATGALYRASANGAIVQIHDGLVVANGIAWNREGTTIYFSDSARGQLYMAPWDEESGGMGTPRILAWLDEKAGRPDGGMVDSQGIYWSAGVSAAVLNRIDPVGHVIERICMPCLAPTMCAFGGRDAGRIFVTSLVRPQWKSPGPMEGALFEFRSPVPGVWPSSLGDRPLMLSS